MPVDPAGRVTVPLADGDVVLALDRDEGSYRLLVRATGIARAHARRLRLVHVVREVEWLLDPRPVEVLLEHAVRRGEGLLQDAVDVVAARAPDLRTATRLLRGGLYGALLDQAADAGLVVVGSGRRWPSDPTTGPGAWLRAHSVAPVLVVGGPTGSPTPRGAVGTRR